MDDRLARLFYEDNVLSQIKRLRSDVNLLQKLATIKSVDLQTLPVQEGLPPGFVLSLRVAGQDTALIDHISLTGALGIRLIQLGQNIAILRDGVDHEHGLVRWTSDGGTVFELPDYWEAVTWVTIRGVLEDPFMYSLSADGAQLIFEDTVPAGWTIVALGEIRQV